MAKGKGKGNSPQEGYQPEKGTLDPNDPPGGNVDDILITDGIPDYGGFYKLSHEKQKAVMDRLDGKRKREAMDNDPHINPHAWDEKCWEASMVITSGGGDEIARRYKEFSVWVHHEAVEMATLHYGERPMDNE